uniref:Uncharacterized protein n=1 Tax=Pyramimonas orientalis virus TaxID=455367 RepID=A0A7L9AYM5_POV01|nr:hypothetical protein HWQ62_00193 [Pyramimonas orientalis virus]
MDCWSVSCVYLLLLVLVVCSNYYKYEKFINYHFLKQHIFENTTNLYGSKIEKETNNIHSLNTSISNEKYTYNQRFCKNNSKFFKVDHSRATTDDRKTYVVPIVDTSSGTFSKNKNQCVHPTDPAFQPIFDCGAKYECSDGLSISGKKIIKDAKETCVYDCI